MDRHRMAKRSDDVASLLLGWVAICSPVFTQNRTASRPRELSIAGTDGQPSGLVAVRAEMDGVAEAGMPPLARCCGSDRGGAGGGARTICSALHDRGLGFRRAPRPGKSSGIWREMGAILRLALRPKTDWYGKGFLAEPMESLRNLQP